MRQVRSKYHPMELIKKRLYYKYFEEGKSISKITKELNDPSESVLYKWIQEYRKQKMKELSLNTKEKKELKDIQPSPGFKNAAEELKYLRLLQILPRLDSDFKKKGKRKPLEK